MKKDLNRIGIITLIVIFVLFYFITTFFLDRRNLSKNIPPKEEKIVDNSTHVDEKKIIEDLYDDIKILYDVVNNKFTVNQDDTIIIGDIIYKKITNFDEVMNKLFTAQGEKNYIDTLSNYFAYTDDGYYLAGNLVNYQTYYFRGDETNIYVTSATPEEINGIIYERWTNNNNTLATIKIVKEGQNWLVDNIQILATK